MSNLVIFELFKILHFNDHRINLRNLRWEKVCDDVEEESIDLLKIDGGELYSHLFFSPGAIGFNTLPFLIESRSCSRGDGFLFNGANFLSVAYKIKMEKKQLKNW